VGAAIPDRALVTPEVLIVGAGPAGLTCAAGLAPAVAGEVLVLDRERQPGGVPRYCDHAGYGMRDLRRFIGGPAYARLLAERAERAGARVRTGAMVTGWAQDGSAEVTTPQGLLRVRAGAVVLATGARERPRSARLVPGDRPAGVLTTGQLQSMVHGGVVDGPGPGRAAVVVGAELVSWSAVLTLRAAGCRVVLMTTDRSVPESYAAVRLAGRLGLRVPLSARTRLRRIVGRGRVSAVEIEDLDTGAVRRVACDTVVFTADWIPDGELARSLGLLMDAGSGGPLVDAALRTSRDGVFAVGNLVHPVDTADVAALDGRHAAGQVLAWLRGERAAAGGAGQVRLIAGDPFRWIAPGLLRRGDVAPARGRLLLWSERLVRFPELSVWQGGTEIARRRMPWPAAPGRVFRVPASVLAHVDFSAGDVTVRLRGGAAGAPGAAGPAGSAAA
jgi:thioredoxin reductase